MKSLLLFPLLWFFVSYPVRAQRKVAQYSIGKYGTAQYEHFAFLTNQGGRDEIFYSYGKHPHEIEVRYYGRDTLDGRACFKVLFSNGLVLYIIPNRIQLIVTDHRGQYEKTFDWEYEGPIDGRGTHCEDCAEDDTEAMRLLRSAYLK